MNYHEFVDTVKKEVKERVGEDMIVTIEKTIKNNGMILDSLVIRNRNYDASPVQYLNPYYEKYKESNDLEWCINEIMLICNKNELKENIDLSYIKEWEKVKDKVRLMLINKELNEKLLSAMPYQEFLDLAIVFYIEIVNDKLGQATVKITNQLFYRWRVTYEELYHTAYSNMMNYNKPQIKSMNQVMEDITKTDFTGSKEECNRMKEELFKEKDKDKFMYILTNENKIKGAVGILCKKMLDEFANEVNSGFYILLSSIHESILIPDDGSYNSKDLRNMVKEVNIEVVNKEEVLSDKIYYFDREKSEVFIA